jgi:hypothetical protein
VCNGEVTCKRGSVGACAPGGHPSVRSTRKTRTGRPSSCSTLLRVGFTEPTPSPTPLVRSYRTVSPSPVACQACPSAVFLCCTSVRSPRPGSRQHPARWSPDFPRPVRRHAAATRSPHHCVAEPTPQSQSGVAGQFVVDECVGGRRLHHNARSNAVEVAGTGFDLDL